MPATSQAIKSLLQIRSLSTEQVWSLFDKIKKLKSGENPFSSPLESSRVLALVFLEPSTRTRLSFEMAAHRLGIRTLAFAGDSTTSLAKGESLRETLATILAMKPDAVVVRHPGDVSVQTFLEKVSIPVINAGDGRGEHPTQALLDAYTVLEHRGQIEGERVLFIGDVEHSRVARSGRELFQLLGAEVAVCAPQAMQPRTADWMGSRSFDKLEEALKWCTVCIGLRIQKERHTSGAVGDELNQADYVRHYRLDSRNLSRLGAEALIMHPGPFVAGVDLSEEVLLDPRCRIHEQVTNGVYVRMAILGEIFGLSGT